MAFISYTERPISALSSVGEARAGLIWVDFNFHPGISECSTKKKLFGNDVITIESFKKKKFEIWCHMMGCNHSLGKHGQRGGDGLCSTYIGHLPC